MNFFQQLFELSETLDFTMTAKRKGEKITLSVLPGGCADLAPVIITGTPQQLDEGFIEAIRSPLGAAEQLRVNTEAFKDSAKAGSTGKSTTPAEKEKAGKPEKKKLGDLPQVSLFGEETADQAANTEDNEE